MLASEIEKQINDWLQKNAVEKDGKWFCKRCGEELWGKGKYLPVHEGYTLFKRHAGGGEVREIVFPYCKKCDKGIEHFSNICCIDF